jgi:hypothetical protein
MEVRPIQPHEIEAARQLLFAAGWDRCVRDPAEFTQLLERSSVKQVAMERPGVVASGS